MVDGGGPGTPFWRRYCAAIHRSVSGGPDPLWTHAGQHLSFHGWLHVAIRHAMQTLHCGLLEPPPRDRRNADDGRQHPREAIMDEAADVGCKPGPGNERAWSSA